MKKVLVIVALLMCACLAKAEPFEGWTREEKEWFALGTVLQIVDYQTTRDLLYRQRDRGFYEMNPFIGPHPSPERLMAFEIGTLIGNYFLTDWLSHENRMTWLKIHVGVEFLAISNNISIGAKISF
jgi:hypothetical protein